MENLHRLPRWRNPSSARLAFPEDHPGRIIPFKFPVISALELRGTGKQFAGAKVDGEGWILQPRKNLRRLFAIFLSRL